MTRDSRVPWRRRVGLSQTLTLTVGSVIGILLIIALAGAYWLVTRESYRSLDLSLVRSANALVLEHQRGETISTTTNCRWLSAPACTQITIIGDQTSSDGLPVPDDVDQIASGSRTPKFHTEYIAGKEYRLYVIPLKDNTGSLTVGYRADSVEKSLERTRWLFVGLAALSLVLGVSVSALISRALLRDLRSVTATAEAIADSHDTGLRLNMSGTDELAQLGRSFDAMVNALDSSLTAQRSLVADASHELRTPLTAIRANAQLATNPDLDPARQAAARASLHGAIDDMTILVGDVLDLARGVEPDPFVEPLRLDELVELTVAGIRAAWPERTIILDFPEAVVLGSDTGLSRLVGNLVTNAVKYSTGVVEVGASLSETDVRLTVRDYGPGIPVKHRQRVFDRFYRAPGSGSQQGSGLGLALAQQIAFAHGTRVEPEWPPSGGTIMSIDLRLVSPDEYVH